jgi:hypothetical protein
MKKIMYLAFAAAMFTACNNETENTTTDTDTTASTLTTETPATTTTTTYTPNEGDVSYREKRVQVWRGGAWVDADDDVKLDNNVVVYRNGRASRDGKEVELEDGYTVDRSGNVWDRTGNAVDNVWEGVKDAGKAVREAGRDVKDEVTGDEAKDATR